MGGLVKRGETCTATFSPGGDPQTDEKRYGWIRLRATAKNEAQTELAALVAEHIEGRLRAATAKLTVKEFLEGWLAHAKGQVRPFTYEKYEEAARTRLVPHLGDVKLTKLTPLVIQDTYTKLLASSGAQGPAPEAIGTRRATAKRERKSPWPCARILKALRVHSE